MNSHITICRGVGEPTRSDCVDNEDPRDVAVPCKVEKTEADACELTTGDAALDAEREQEIACAEDCCCCD